ILFVYRVAVRRTLITHAPILRDGYNDRCVDKLNLPGRFLLFGQQSIDTTSTNKEVPVMPLKIAETTLSPLIAGLQQNKWRASELLNLCLSAIDQKDDPENQVYTARFDRTAKAEAAAIDALQQ